MSSINAQALGDMAKFVAGTKATIQQVDREIKLEIGRRLVDYSPVGDPTTWHPPYWPKGYVPGLFINNWFVGIDAMPSGTTTVIDATGSGSLERMTHLGRWTVGHTHYFANNLPYAALLESGEHSLQVPPGGMVGRVTLEFPQIVADAIAKVAREQRWAFGGI